MALCISAITLVAVRGALEDEEAEAEKRGDATPVHDDISPSVLINSGMELEDQQ